MTIKVEVIQGGNAAQIEARLQEAVERGFILISVLSHGGRVMAVLEEEPVPLTDRPAPVVKPTEEGTEKEPATKRKVRVHRVER